MFVKTLPVRAIINYDSTFSEFVKYLHELLIEINSKQIYDLSNIMSDINSKREHPLLSLFQVVFVFLDQEKGDQSEATRFDFQHTDSKYPLTLYVKEYDDVMDFRLEYSNAYFTPSDMELLAEQFQNMIRKIMSGPDTKIIELLHENNLGDAVVDDNIIFNI
ncbi:Linear gramicidin synthase subunit B [compost metagenome]